MFQVSINMKHFVQTPFTVLVRVLKLRGEQLRICKNSSNKYFEVGKNSILRPNDDETLTKELRATLQRVFGRLQVLLLLFHLATQISHLKKKKQQKKLVSHRSIPRRSVRHPLLPPGASRQLES